MRFPFAGRRVTPFMLMCALAWPVGGCGKSAKPDAKGSKPAPESAADAPKAGENAGGAWQWQLPKGLHQAPPVPADNPMTKAKVALGHRLFMDKRLSTDGSRSCYSCHQNQLGNADGRPKALGAKDKALPRNTPTIWNVAYHTSLYWDGRAPSLEKQALGAWKGGNMGVGADNLEAKAAEIGALPEYAKEFSAVFGLEPGAKVTPMHVVQAISAYERTLLCGDTAHDLGTSDEAAKRGYTLFMGKGACMTCHLGDNFSDGLFHNVGIGLESDGSPGPNADIGRAKPSGNDADKYKFRTPTLRNVAKTGPYFHDGSVAELEAAVRYMGNGPHPKAEGLDPLLRDNKLTDAEIKDIVAFLKSLDCGGELEVLGDQKVAGIPY